MGALPGTHTTGKIDLANDFDAKIECYLSQNDEVMR